MKTQKRYSLCLYVIILKSLLVLVKSQCSITVEDELWPKQWYLNKTGDVKYDMNVLPAWRMCINGTGVTVGVVDKGVQDHIDLNIDRQISFGDVNEGNVNSLKHGTRVAGIIGSLKNDNFTIGIAFGAKIADIKIASTAVFETFDPAALIHNMQDIHVYSCSFANFHTGSKSYPLLKEQEDAFKTGTSLGRQGKGNVYVFATGNSGSELELFPDSCSYDRLVTNRYVISVAGIQYDLTKVPSGEGCSAMLVAAFTAEAGSTKNLLVTTDIGNTSTEYFNQNSAAAPMVSGAVALALSANPNLTYRDVMHLLVKTSRSNLTEFRHNFTKNAAGLYFSRYFGFGLLDIGALVSESRTWNNVPKKLTTCSVTYTNTYPINRVTSHWVHLNCSEVTYNEHVEVSLRVEHPHAGRIKWVLISPYGTKSIILPGREIDPTTYMNLTVLTAHLWGENPTGYWILEPTMKFDYNTITLDGGNLKSFDLTVYGFTCTKDFNCLEPAFQDPSKFTTMSPAVTISTDRETEDKKMTRTVLALIIVCAVVLPLVFILVGVLVCYKKKLLCFQKSENFPTEQGVPLNT